MARYGLVEQRERERERERERDRERERERELPSELQQELHLSLTRPPQETMKSCRVASSHAQDVFPGYMLYKG